jgi:hypothetical protein
VDYAQENAIKAMTFESVALQNMHLANWEKTVADTRIHGTTKKHVGKQFEEIEKPTLGALPLEYFPCFEEGVRKVSRDGHIEVKGGFYSVPPEYLGSDGSDRSFVCFGGIEVDPSHVVLFQSKVSRWRDRLASNNSQSTCR